MSWISSPRFPSSKFCTPKPLPQYVRRPRLVSCLEDGADRRLTLVVGSPGSGKTMLLADWIARRPAQASSWLTCDSADAEPTRFFAAVIESLRRSSGQADIGEDAFHLLAYDGSVSADAVAALADDLERLSAPHVLVIDDLSSAAPGGTDTLATLLEYRPPSLQVVVATRVDPQLRLHRMRLSGELLELRDRDLSFLPAETKAFLSSFGVHLDDEQLAVLHGRTEGWAVALQMAAISIRDSPNAESSTLRAEVQVHTVAGHFLEEVLYRQPRDLADFMLAVSVLDELSPRACAAVYGTSSGSLLERMWDSHLFVTLLDYEARLYRYHPLIRDVLRAELHVRDPEKERRLHLAAATYLADTGGVGAAVRHLLAAGDAAGAFRMLGDRLVSQLITKATIGSALDIDGLEPDIFSGRPEFLIPLAGELFLQGAFDRGARALTLAERAAIDEREQPELACRLACIRALHCQIVGELDEALEHRATARALATRDADDWITALDGVALYCHGLRGNTALTRDTVEAIASTELNRPPVRDVLCPGVISQAALAEGALEEAGLLALSSLTSAHRLGFDRHYFAFAGTRTSALLALERRDLVAATEANERALSLLLSGRPVFDYLAQLDRAQIWAAAGDLDGALASLPAARGALRSERSSLLAQAGELEARLRLALGDRQGALRIVEDLPVDRRFVVSAIIALNGGAPQRAAELLAEAPAPETIRSHLEHRLLRASIAIQQDAPDAPRLVRAALTLLNDHGYVQTVLDSAPDLVRHLIAHSDRYPSTETSRALIAAGIEFRRRDGAHEPSGRLPDPLTDAGLRVLVKLSQQLTYADMAADLHLSLNTVKTHLRHAYMKLGVTSKSTALRRAVSLGLL